MRMKLRELSESCQDVAVTDVAVTSNPLTKVIAEKLAEDGELIAGLIALVPEASEEWRPDWPVADGSLPFSAFELAKHLAESYAALAACLKKLHPERLSHFKASPIGDSLASFQSSVSRSNRWIAEGFLLTKDSELSTLIPTYFAPEGDPFLATLWANQKHVQHHFYQLFVYLKLMGLPMGTQHLHHFRK